MFSAAIELQDPPTKECIAFAINRMTYVELRELARELCATATTRADPVEELGGFDVDNTIHWQELLADWAEATACE